MKIEVIFYILGVIFIFVTVFYFSYEYIFDLSNIVKTILLVLLTVISFFVADSLLEKDK